MNLPILKLRADLQHGRLQAWAYFDSYSCRESLRPRAEQGLANWGRYASARWLGFGFVVQLRRRDL